MRGEGGSIVKRTLAVFLTLVLLVLFAFPLSRAQGPDQPPGDQIDDLTPPKDAFETKGDDSDDRRIPEAYLQATGGPDPFGYTYADSDGGGCPYDWLEIEGSGTGLRLDGDDVGDSFELGFGFPFYGNVHSTIGVSSNGYLTFGPDLTDYTEDAIPDPVDPNDLIALFWDDQESDLGAGDDVYYQLFGAPGSHYLVVEFVVRDASGSAPYRYEAVLFENGDIKFQYSEMATDSDGSGVSASVGIENGTGTEGLGYQYHLYPPENVIHNDLAVCFTYPDSVYLTPGWQASYGLEGAALTYELAALNQTGATREFPFRLETRPGRLR